MKFKKDDLLKALDQCKLALGNSKIIPILNCFCFTGDSVFTYNDVVSVQVDFKTDFTGAVEGKTFLSVIKNLPNEEVEIQQKNNELHIKSGKSKVKLPLHKEEDFIFKFPEESSSDFLRFNKDFLFGVKKCLTSLPKTFIRSDLNSITLYVNENSMSLYSSDDKTISCFEFEQETKKPYLIGTYLLPDSFVKTLLSIFDSEVAFQVFEDYIISVKDDVKVFTKIQDTEPLPYRRVVSDIISEFDKKDFGILPVPEKLKESVERVSLLKDAEDVKFSVSEGNLQISSNSGKGEIVEEIEFENHPDITIYLNPSLIKKGISVCEEFYLLENGALMMDGNYIYLVSGKVESE